MKILLISANTVTTPYPVYPLGLDHVAGVLRPNHEVVVIDMNVAGNPETLAARVREAAPDLVGIAIRNIDSTDQGDPTGFVTDARRVAEAVRSVTDAPLVLGGSGFTIFPDALMTALDADYGIVGEGERLPALCRALETGADPYGLPGVVLRGRPAVTPPPLDAPPSRIAGPGPHADFYLFRGGMMNLQSRRGCPFRCVYCTYPHIEGRRLRNIPPDEVADTAVALQAAGARYLFLTDSAFNADVDHSLEVAAAFRRAGLSIPWGGFFAPLRPSPEYFRDMAAAGLTHVEFGTESWCDAVLDAYGKPYSPSDALAAHEAAVAAGIHVAHYLLLGGPGETRDTVRETLDNIDRLKRSVLFFFRGMRIYPHTALHGIAVREGIIAPDADLLAPCYYHSAALDGTTLIDLVRRAAAGRSNWIMGAGGDQTATLLSRMYRRGRTGPLWEYLIR